MRVATSMENAPITIAPGTYVEKAIQYVLAFKMKNPGLDTPVINGHRGSAVPALPDQLRLELGWRSAYYK